MKQITYYIFGKRAEGVKIPSPSFKSTQPSNRPNIQEWAKEFKFGSRFGCRGSFYENKPHVLKLNGI